MVNPVLLSFFIVIAAVTVNSVPYRKQDDDSFAHFADMLISEKNRDWVNDEDNDWLREDEDDLQDMDEDEEEHKGDEDYDPEASAPTPSPGALVNGGSAATTESAVKGGVPATTQPAGKGGAPATTQPTGKGGAPATTQPARTGGVPATTQPTGKGGAPATTQPAGVGGGPNPTTGVQPHTKGLSGTGIIPTQAPGAAQKAGGPHPNSCYEKQTTCMKNYPKYKGHCLHSIVHCQHVCHLKDEHCTRKEYYDGTHNYKLCYQALVACLY